MRNSLRILVILRPGRRHVDGPIHHAAACLLERIRRHFGGVYRFGLNHESLDDWLAWRYPRYGVEHILFLPPVEEEEEEDPFWQRQQLN